MRRDNASMVDPLMGFTPRTSFKSPWLQRWMRVASALANFWMWVVLSVFYVIAVSPIALVFRFLSDPLHVKTREAVWHPASSQHNRLEDASRQS